MMRKEKGRTGFEDGSYERFKEVLEKGGKGGKRDEGC